MAGLHQANQGVCPSAKHIQSEGLTAEINNNRSERLPGTYRDREKTLRGLNGLESGQHYLDGWTLRYNLFRKHHSLGNRTPGEAAGIDALFGEWADVVRGGTVPEVTIESGSSDGWVTLRDLSAAPRAQPIDLGLTDSDMRRVESQPGNLPHLRFEVYAPPRAQNVGNRGMTARGVRGLAESRYRGGR